MSNRDKECDLSSNSSETNYEMVKKMNSIEFAAWIAVQIKMYYKSDNIIIFEDEVNSIVDKYLEWFDMPVK